jgi:hypothetical protein
LALRVLCTAYLLNNAYPPGLFIEVPSPDIEVDDSDSVLPQGPPQDPHQPLLADEEVFVTHHRHSDFDRATLVRDRARALQFLRHEHVQKNSPSSLLTPLSTALTNNVGQILPNMILTNDDLRKKSRDSVDRYHGFSCTEIDFCLRSIFPDLSKVTRHTQ